MGKEIETIAGGGETSFRGFGREGRDPQEGIKNAQTGHSVTRSRNRCGLSKGEVMLLLKVHSIILRPLEAGGEPG